MRIDTITGLHGTLVDYHHTGSDYSRTCGEAIILRDDPTFPDRPFSVHSLYEVPGRFMGDPSSGLGAENGRYDLTLDEARTMLRLPL